MALFVNTNVSALNGQRNLQGVTDRMNSSFEKLSSGSRINSSKDDAAGLQISDRLTTQIIGLQQGTRNANDGISIAQIAEGALSEVTNNIQRMRQLVVQGGNRTLSASDRSALGQEFEKLLNINNDIADRTAFGTVKLLNSDSPSSGFQIQSGAQAGEQDTVTTGNAELTALFGKIASDEGISGDMSAISTGIQNYGTIGKIVAGYMVMTNVTDAGVAADALFGTRLNTSIQANELSDKDTTLSLDTSKLTALLNQDATVVVDATGKNQSVIAGTGGIFAVTGVIDSLTGYNDTQLQEVHGKMTDILLDAMSSLVTQVDKQRAKLGAEQNGLASTIRSNTTAVVNVSDSRARITDTDFASETAELTRNQIIQQAATSILSQANQLPQAALSLLG